MLRMLTFAYYMSERITIVVPDGTRQRLKDKADKQGHTSSALGRKLLIDGLKTCEHLWTAKGAGGAMKMVCSICGCEPNVVSV